jgi:hypothetical protein
MAGKYSRRSGMSLGDALYKALLLTSVLLLAGCTDADWDHLTSFDPPPGAPSAAPSVLAYPDDASGATAASYATIAAPPSITAACTRTADERSGDAAYQEFDADTRQQVYEKTYADCMTWATAHPSAR